MLSYEGFLHDHPGLQAKLGLDAEHVIVDKGDWVSARQENSESPVNNTQQLKAKISEFRESLEWYRDNENRGYANGFLNKLDEIQKLSAV